MASEKKGRRRKIPEPERFKLWVRAGGRCEICNRYLLEGQLAHRELTFGEAAHIIGQRANERSPRGLEDDLGPAERDYADNLMLVCDDEHDELDKPGSADAFGIEFLRELKRRHEDRVYHQTSMAPHLRTCPIRMIAELRGRTVELDRSQVAAAVMHGAGRFPEFEFSSRNTIEIDLRGLPGEREAGPDYYRAATAKIDQVVDHKIADAVAQEHISHLSVFAFARLPLLIYLGTKLDDVVATDIYQRHRSTEAWKWPEPDATADFAVSVPEASDDDEAVLVINVSGTIQRDELPAEVDHLTLLKIAVKDQTPHPDVLSGPEALAAFEHAVRALLAEMEDRHKHVRRLHLFAAMPLSAGVTFGRVFDPDVHASLAIYDRVSDGYSLALEVGNR